jgi:ABC-type Fe3+-citrate transport system substrate-binding protein
MQNLIKIFLLLISCLMATACSDESNNADTKKDHVWKETTETIDRAKEVEGMMMDAAKNTQRALDQQNE